MKILTMPFRQSKTFTSMNSCLKTNRYWYTECSFSRIFCINLEDSSNFVWQINSIHSSSFKKLKLLKILWQPNILIYIIHPAQDGSDSGNIRSMTGQILTTKTSWSKWWNFLKFVKFSLKNTFKRSSRKYKRSFLCRKVALTSVMKLINRKSSGSNLDQEILLEVITLCLIKEAFSFTKLNQRLLRWQ